MAKGELARSVRRHLRDEPVEARPPTTAYRVERFVARHRLAAPALDLRTANTSVEQIPADDTIRVGSSLLTGQITGPGRGREGVISILVRPVAGRTAPESPPASTTRPDGSVAS